MRTYPAPWIKRIFRKLKKTSVLLMKPSGDIDPNYGNIPSYTTYTISAVVVPSLTRELLYRPVGELEEGQLRLFVEPEYNIDGKIVKVETDDRIRIGDIEGVVLSVYDYIIPEYGIVLKECLVR